MPRIRVIPHEKILPVLAKWKQAFGKESRTLWNEFVDEITAGRAGIPDGAIEVRDVKPVTYWCSFPGGGQARLKIREGTNKIFVREIDVIIVELRFSPQPLPK